VFLLVVLTDKIKGIYTIPPQDAKIQIKHFGFGSEFFLLCSVHYTIPSTSDIHGGALTKLFSFCERLFVPGLT
jgi:hypothetical protein